MPTRPPRAFARLATLSLVAVLTACGPKDADIKAGIDTAISGVSGVTVDVAGGVATIAGEFADSASMRSTEALVKGVKGVKSVVVNATVTPPPPPVVISADDSLKTNIAAVLKDYAGLMAEVQDGVVTLTGDVNKADLPKVMQALSALNPKQIANKAIVKK